MPKSLMQVEIKTNEVILRPLGAAAPEPAIPAETAAPDEIEGEARPVLLDGPDIPRRDFVVNADGRELPPLEQRSIEELEACAERFVGYATATGAAIVQNERLSRAVSMAASSAPICALRAATFVTIWSYCSLVT